MEGWNVLVTFREEGVEVMRFSCKFKILVEDHVASGAELLLGREIALCTNFPIQPSLRDTTYVLFSEHYIKS